MSNITLKNTQTVTKSKGILWMNSASGSLTTSPYKKFTAVELRARREKGLCYYCDDKYIPNHKCKSSCFLLVGQEEFKELLQEGAATQKDEVQVSMLV